MTQCFAVVLPGCKMLWLKRLNLHLASQVKRNFFKTHLLKTDQSFDSAVEARALNFLIFFFFFLICATNACLPFFFVLVIFKLSVVFLLRNCSILGLRKAIYMNYYNIFIFFIIIHSCQFHSDNYKKDGGAWRLLDTFHFCILPSTLHSFNRSHKTGVWC